MVKNNLVQGQNGGLVGLQETDLFLYALYTVVKYSCYKVCSL